MEILVGGNCWWADASGDVASPQIILTFEAISEGVLPVPFDPSCDEDLDDFFVSAVSDLDWAQTCCNEIYCHGPLRDPGAMYALLQAFLAGVGAFKVPGDFFNSGHLLTNFTKITSGGSYLLARVPDVVCRLLSSELERQAVSYNVIRGTSRLDDRLWVRFGTEGFLCAAAWADFD